MPLWAWIAIGGAAVLLVALVLISIANYPSDNSF